LCSRPKCRGYKRSEAQKARDAARNRRPDIAERNKQRSSEWYATEHGRAWVREHGAKRYADHHDEIRAQQREKYKKDPEHRARILADSKLRRLNLTPEQRAAKNVRQAIRKKTDHGRMMSRMHTQIRRNRLRTTLCDLTDEQVVALLEAYGQACAYCDCVFDRTPMSSNKLQATIDHVNPIALGGHHTLANVVPACRGCNMKKLAKPPEEALALFGIDAESFWRRHQQVLAQLSARAA
jgi:5-methylcytosine-specific restriction endonuclease McrA